MSTRGCFILEINKLEKNRKQTKKAPAKQRATKKAKNKQPKKAQAKQKATKKNSNKLKTCNRKNKKKHQQNKEQAKKQRNLAVVFTVLSRQRESSRGDTKLLLIVTYHDTPHNMLQQIFGHVKIVARNQDEGSRSSDMIR